MRNRGGNRVRAVLVGRALKDLEELPGKLKAEFLRRLDEEGLPRAPDGLDTCSAPHDPDFLILRLRLPIPGYHLFPGQSRYAPIKVRDKSEELFWVLYRELTFEERADMLMLPRVQHAVFGILPNREAVESGVVDAFDD